MSSWFCFTLPWTPFVFDQSGTVMTAELNALLGTLWVARGEGFPAVCTCRTIFHPGFPARGFDFSSIDQIAQRDQTLWDLRAGKQKRSTQHRWSLAMHGGNKSPFSRVLWNLCRGQSPASCLLEIWQSAKHCTSIKAALWHYSRTRLWTNKRKLKIEKEISFPEYIIILRVSAPLPDASFISLPHLLSPSTL